MEFLGKVPTVSPTPMKLPKLLLAVAFLSIVTISARAADSSKIPNIKGTWVGEYTAYHHDGVGTSVQTLTITDQGPTGFRGVREWTRKSFTPAHGTKQPPLKTKKNLFTGVVGFDDKTLYFADQGQSSYLIGELIGRDKMRIIFLMAGDRAIAFRATLTRVKP